MFEQAESGESRSSLSDWMGRGAIALLFVFEGAAKFGSGWTKLFEEIGFGQWLRYFTGVVEILGGVLVLVPWTVEVGLAILSATMASAALLMAFARHRPQDSVFSGALFIGLAAYWWNRKS
jgi:uncharacterized membrane protein YphA (DoxX/SURF4 family)